jgi:isopentenyl-diphosphate delta-isomerase
MSAGPNSTVGRKQAHLDLCRTQDVSSLSKAGWENFRLPHRALPELDFAQVTTECQFLGHSFATPFLISSMTGGSPEGERINQMLAEFAEARRIPMGVGSQRVALENRAAGLFRLRQVAPRATLFANIGVVQLNYGVTVDDCRWLVDQLEAQALILHANPLQEAIQTEGDRNFAQLWSRVRELKRKLPVPLILKETGCGLDGETCARAAEAGIDALDVAGLGGTHWGFIEGLRDPKRRALGEIFRDWGIPTAEALIEAREAAGPELPIIASGGVRDALDAAKAAYLGADLVGMALPFLKKAAEGPQALHEFLDLQTEALRIALFCSGLATWEAMKKHHEIESD